eukprot:jgi/Chlat1/648/Chrsp103S00966
MGELMGAGSLLVREDGAASGGGGVGVGGGAVGGDGVDDGYRRLVGAVQRARRAGVAADDPRLQALGRLAAEERARAWLAAGSAGDNDGDEGGGAATALVAQLRAQLKAFTLLSRNAPVSSQLLSAATADCVPFPSPPALNKLQDVARPALPAGAVDQSSDGEVAVHNGPPAMPVVVREGSGSPAPDCQQLPYAQLKQQRESRFSSKRVARIQELQELQQCLPLHLQSACLIELKQLQLVGLQQRLRSHVALEKRLQEHCSSVDTLFEWTRLHRSKKDLLHAEQIEAAAAVAAAAASAAVAREKASGISDEERRRIDAERLLRNAAEERARAAAERRRFLLELSNHSRDFRSHTSGVAKKRKQTMDLVQNWHARERVRAGRAEKQRLMALKADDQEAYLKLVEESKNERLNTLLGKTDELLQQLGTLVRQQKGKGGEDEEDEESEAAPSEVEGAHRDLLAGQKRYNAMVHRIEEKVAGQPTLLQGGTLRSYQVAGLQWMLSLYNNNLNGILADEMGLGKTVQTIALLAYLLEHKGVQGPHLIVAPKAVLSNWMLEFNNWVPDSMVAVLYDGPIADRRVIREQIARDGSNFNVVVTHYDLIMRDKAFLSKIQWHYIIIDEGHRLKNHECQLARALAGAYETMHRLLLTGTPIQNSLSELWSLLNFLLPSIFNSQTNFEQWFNAPFANSMDIALTDEEELLIINRLHQVLRPFLLRRKKLEVEKELPQKMSIVLRCDMSAWQKVYYKQIVESSSVGIEGQGTRVKGLQNVAMQLRKCCNHPYLFLTHVNYVPARDDEIFRSSGKFELLDRMLPKLRAAGHRVLLFSQMTRAMDILEDYLSWKQFRYLRLDGNTKTEDRGELLREFNAKDSEYFIFLLSTRAGGLGLNLQTADTVIMFDSDWNPQMDQQAEDRAHRIGQKKEVRVFVLCCVGSVEEDILARADSKKAIDAKVIQAGMFNNSATAQERREFLEEVLRRGTESLGRDVPSERETNRLIARSDDEFRMYERMDKERRLREQYTARLLTEDELPDWVFQPEDISKKNADSQQADGDGTLTGRRVRKEVQYADVLTDRQWLQVVDNGGDLQSAVQKEKAKHKQKSASHKLTADDSQGTETIGNAPDGKKKKKKSLHQHALENNTNGWMPASRSDSGNDSRELHVGNHPKTMKRPRSGSALADEDELSNKDKRSRSGTMKAEYESDASEHVSRPKRKHSKRHLHH